MADGEKKVIKISVRNLVEFVMREKNGRRISEGKSCEKTRKRVKRFACAKDSFREPDAALAVKIEAYGGVKHVRPKTLGSGEMGHMRSLCRGAGSVFDADKLNAFSRAAKVSALADVAKR